MWNSSFIPFRELRRVVTSAISCAHEWGCMCLFAEGACVGGATTWSSAAGDHEGAQSQSHLYQNQGWWQRVCVCQLWWRLYHLGRGVSTLTASSVLLNKHGSTRPCSGLSSVKWTCLWRSCSQRAARIPLACLQKRFRRWSQMSKMNDWVSNAFRQPVVFVFVKHLKTRFVRFFPFCISCRRFVSLQMVIANTLFQTVCFHPDVYQIITSGADRKVCIWIINQSVTLVAQCQWVHVNFVFTPRHRTVPSQTSSCVLMWCSCMFLLYSSVWKSVFYSADVSQNGPLVMRKALRVQRGWHFTATVIIIIICSQRVCEKILLPCPYTVTHTCVSTD